MRKERHGPRIEKIRDNKLYNVFDQS
jgi:hypothetical protein